MPANFHKRHITALTWWFAFQRTHNQNLLFSKKDFLVWAEYILALATVFDFVINFNGVEQKFSLHSISTGFNFY